MVRCSSKYPPRDPEERRWEGDKLGSPESLQASEAVGTTCVLASVRNLNKVSFFPSPYMGEAKLHT